MGKRPRIDVYIADPEIHRSIEIAAARNDMRISQWCLKVIIERLAEEELLLKESSETRDVPAMLQALQDQIKARRGGAGVINLDEQLEEARLEREDELLMSGG